MSVQRVVPNIKSARFDESRTFYTELLGFDVVMDMGWVVTFASPSSPTAQVTLLGDSGSAAPHPNISIEVSDVDAVHAKAIERGLQIVYPLTDEPWGVRRFYVVDPNGVVINVMSHRK
jgi:catechol 2,3-dioxygenase-like lactoylglutathione lyase family enzyme